MKCEICKEPGRKISLKIQGHAGTFSWHFCDAHMITAVDGECLTKQEIEYALRETRSRGTWDVMIQEESVR